jgi:YHS domain-containing protein
MLGWVLRFALLVLLVSVAIRAVWRFLEGIVQGASDPRRGSPGGVPQAGGRMVKDPVCGTYVVQARALTASRGEETAWFCSEACRVQWKQRRT